MISWLDIKYKIGSTNTYIKCSIFPTQFNIFWAFFNASLCKYWEHWKRETQSSVGSVVLPHYAFLMMSSFSLYIYFWSHSLLCPIVSPTKLWNFLSFCNQSFFLVVKSLIPNLMRPEYHTWITPFLILPTHINSIGFKQSLSIP